MPGWLDKAQALARSVFQTGHNQISEVKHQEVAQPEPPAAGARAADSGLGPLPGVQVSSNRLVLGFGIIPPGGRGFDDPARLLDAVQAGKPGAIVVAAGLGDALAVVKELRRQQALADVPIGVVGIEERGREKEFFQAGADEYFPAWQEEVIERLLGGAGGCARCGPTPLRKPTAMA
ncbi:MAG: hypothetical protein PWQ18_674 [Clostridia bacterium]|nr:hypothetical protein [Clostridia bacterium]